MSLGVAAGIDLAHLFLKQLFGEKVARAACRITEYEASESNEDPFCQPEPVPALKNRQGRTLRLVLVAYDQRLAIDHSAGAQKLMRMRYGAIHNVV